MCTGKKIITIFEIKKKDADLIISICLIVYQNLFKLHYVDYIVKYHRQQSLFQWQCALGRNCVRLTFGISRVNW